MTPSRPLSFCHLMKQVGCFSLSVKAPDFHISKTTPSTPAGFYFLPGAVSLKTDQSETQTSSFSMMGPWPTQQFCWLYSPGSLSNPEPPSSFSSGTSDRGTGEGAENLNLKARGESPGPRGMAAVELRGLEEVGGRDPRDQARPRPCPQPSRMRRRFPFVEV